MLLYFIKLLIKTIIQLNNSLKNITDFSTGL